MNFQGANASALEKEIGSEQFPVNEHYFGLVNVRIYMYIHMNLKYTYTLNREFHLFPFAIYLLNSLLFAISVWEHVLL